MKKTVLQSVVFMAAFGQAWAQTQPASEAVPVPSLSYNQQQAPVVVQQQPQQVIVQQQPQVVVMPPPGVVVPPGVVYVAPAYASPGIGFVWTYHPRYGWGWYHPRHGWHKHW